MASSCAVYTATQAFGLTSTLSLLPPLPSNLDLAYLTALPAYCSSLVVRLVACSVLMYPHPTRHTMILPLSRSLLAGNRGGSGKASGKKTWGQARMARVAIGLLELLGSFLAISAWLMNLAAVQSQCSCQHHRGERSECSDDTWPVLRLYTILAHALADIHTWRVGVRLFLRAVRRCSLMSAG